MNSKNSHKKPTNFIRNIINKDLSSGKHKSVITRFPPEPNGYLHIGHAKSICLNFGTAGDYDGWCNLRFDDTNPAKEEVEYVESIKKDVNWLGFEWHGKVKYSSDYFDKFYQCAIELVSKGLAYVCFLSPDESREYRGTLTKPGENSPHRDTPIEKNLALFKKMKEGGFKEGECVLRGKIDMSSSFICMRDPVFYRIRFDSHHQTDNLWCIYPMYDFAHCLGDAIEGVTHSLCTLEFQDNRRIYDWILDNLDEFNKLDRPQQYEFSRLNLEYTVMSKRKLQKLVENKLVSGWNDPRMPTLSGFRRRGYTSASIRNFAQRIGISKVDSVIDVGILEASIRDDLNVAAPRTMAVLNPIKLVIENYPKNKLETLQALIHPQNEAMGKREIFFGRDLYIDKEDFLEKSPNKKYKRLALDKEVRLRNAYVIKADHVEYNENGEVSTLYCRYDPETLGKNPPDGRKINGVIHFVEASKALEAEFRIYDRLFLDPNPGNFEDLSSVINPESIKVRKGFLEPTMLNAKPEIAYQFERVGYFCRDNKSDELVFNKTVSLRDSYK